VLIPFSLFCESVVYQRFVDANPETPSHEIAQHVEAGFLYLRIKYEDFDIYGVDIITAAGMFPPAKGLVAVSLYLEGLYAIVKHADFAADWRKNRLASAIFAGLAAEEASIQ
jgi:hypothetical protein